MSVGAAPSPSRIFLCHRKESVKLINRNKKKNKSIEKKLRKKAFYYRYLSVLVKYPSSKSQSCSVGVGPPPTCIASPHPAPSPGWSKTPTPLSQLPPTTPSCLNPDFREAIYDLCEVSRLWSLNATATDAGTCSRTEPGRRDVLSNATRTGAGLALERNPDTGTCSRTQPGQTRHILSNVTWAKGNSPRMQTGLSDMLSNST